MSTGKRSSILKGLFFYVDNCMILYIYICGPAFGGHLPRDGDGLYIYIYAQMLGI